MLECSPLQQRKLGWLPGQPNREAIGEAIVRRYVMDFSLTSFNICMDHRFCFIRCRLCE